MRRQDKRVLPESHQISEAFLISIDDQVVEFLFPLRHIGLPGVHRWVEGGALGLHEDSWTLGLGESVLDIAHVRGRIDVFVGDWRILVPLTSGFFIYLIHRLIHLGGLIERALHGGCMIRIENASSQMNWIAESFPIGLMKLFIVEECHGENAFALFLLAKLKKTPQRPLDWLSGMYNRVNVWQLLLDTAMEGGNAILYFLPLQTKLDYAGNLCRYGWNLILPLFIMFLNKIV